MSIFLGGMPSPMASFLPETDDRLVFARDQWAKMSSRQAQSFWDDGRLWPRSIGLGGQFSSYGMGMDDAGTCVGKWEPFGTFTPWGAFWKDDSGGAFQNCIVGQTLDQYGNALGNAIVQGFVTATELFIGQVTSDSNGWFKLPTPYPTNIAHYLVCYQASVPPVAGTSINTITPAATG